MLCPKCGNQIPDGSKFCSICGNIMENPNAQTANTYSQTTPKNDKIPFRVKLAELFTVSRFKILFRILAGCIAFVFVYLIVIVVTGNVPSIPHAVNNSHVYSTESSDLAVTESHECETNSRSETSVTAVPTQQSTTQSIVTTTTTQKPPAVPKEHVLTPETTTTKAPPKEKIYGMGDTWIVDGQWKFTVNSVKKHEMCNQFSKLNDTSECILITYSFENIGYTNAIQDLYFCGINFKVYDESGEAAELYPCIHQKSPKVCAVGTKCSNAQQAYALTNSSHKITLIVNNYASNKTGNQKAKYVLNF